LSAAVKWWLEPPLALNYSSFPFHLLFL
jgi:hypothetical protein